MANKFTEKDFIERINSIFPEWNYNIISFNGYKQPAIIQCNGCGKIIKLKKACDITRKINVCECYTYFRDWHDKIHYFSKKYDFSILYENSAQEKIKIRCNRCGCEMQRSLVSLLNTPEHCDKCCRYREGKSHYSKEEIQLRLDNEFNNEYELLEYQGLSKKALLKHKECGYIFTITKLSDLFCYRNKGCPKCYQFKSIGERKIRDYLDREKIKYIPQKTFSPLNKSKYRFDFFLPDYNMAIEYQGEQHFRDNGFFKDGYKTVVYRDNIKRQYCHEHNIELLEIKYTEIKNIDAILTSRFNDYRKQECE